MQKLPSARCWLCRPWRGTVEGAPCRFWQQQSLSPAIFFMGGLTSKTKVLQEFDTNDDGALDKQEQAQLIDAAVAKGAPWPPRPAPSPAG